MFLILSTFGIILTYVTESAYQMTVDGQTYQVNIVSEGVSHQDINLITDDYGEPLNNQKTAICSSLKGDDCPQITNNRANTHNLFNYFPNHAVASVVAHSNAKYNKNTSPHLLKQPLDDRTIKYLSKQNPNNLGNGKIDQKPKTQINPFNNINGENNKKDNNLLLNIFNQIEGLNGENPLNFLTKKKIKYEKRKKKDKTNDELQREKPKLKRNTEEIDEETNNELINGEDNDDFMDIEIYSNIENDKELAKALGLDEDDFSETLDRIVAELVSNYIDNDSDEVDVSQVFANALSVENGGDVSIDLEQRSVDEMSEILQGIAKKHNKKIKLAEMNIIEMDKNDENNINDGTEQVELFEIRFMVDTKGDVDQQEYDENQQNDQDNPEIDDVEYD